MKWRRLSGFWDEEQFAGSSHFGSRFSLKASLESFICMLLKQNERHKRFDRAVACNPGTDGCAPSVDDSKDVTPLMHKISAQEFASSLIAIKLTPVNKMNGAALWYSVGASFAQQPAAPEAHRSPGTAGSSIIGMLEVIERDYTKNLAELDLAEDEAENGSNVSNGFTVWNSV